MTFGPLISPEALRALPVPIRLLDARPGPEAYRAGHLAGALHADLDHDLSGASEPGFDPARGGRHPLPSPARWAAQVASWGIGPDTAVVAYDAAGGGNAASRLWWMLRASGHPRVAVLDGGLQAALAAGLATTVQPPSPGPVQPQSPGPVQPQSPAPVQPPVPAHDWRRPTPGIDEVARLVEDPAWKVLDVRSRERWLGLSEPLDPTPGRIPGTINLPFTENLGPDGRFKPAAALRQRYLELLGGVPPVRLVVHCGSGVTACHTLLALELAGLEGAALYVGSYGEWCRSGRPLGRG